MRRVALPAALFLVAGTLHLIRPSWFATIVPPQFTHPRALVAVSGLAELAGGIGLLIPRTRRCAGYGLLALLIAVWPANWYMAIEADRFADMAPAWALWLRVPLQLPLMWWIERVSR
jgi:uncharacterized membrane protein